MSEDTARAQRLEDERDAIMGQPSHADMFRLPRPGHDPLSMDGGAHVAPLPGTNPAVLCGGLGGGVFTR